MDTSDSEYFESADEEIYLEEDVKKSAQKYDKIVNEAQKDLIHLNIVDSCKKTVEREESNTSEILNNSLNANENPTPFVTNKKYNIDVTSPNIEETISKETILKDTGNITTKLSATRQIDIDNTKCEETDNLSVVHNLDNRNKPETIARNNNDDAVVIEKDTVEITRVEEKKLSNSTQKSELINLATKQEEGNSKIKSVEKSGNDEQKAVESLKKKEEISLNNNKKIDNDILKKELPELEETLEVSDNDENMWENDDWEPISDEKDHKLTENKDKPKVEENMWDNDDWEPFEKVDSQKISQPTEPAWSSWGNWGGVSSIFTTATQGVTTLTSQVSQGLSNVLETGIGIPDPKELAKIDRELEKEQSQEDPSNKTNIGFGFSNLSNLVSGVSHITKFVENTGSKVITGGLDTLETIGKKTMEVLQEGDPGLKNKRALLKLEKDKPILSQVLREAKEKAERENKFQETHSKKKMNYETLFDDFHGLVHLEALEMLSKQCDIKLETLSENCSRDEFQDLQETMDQIKELCELPDEDDDETPTIEDIKEKLESAVKDINVTITYAKLISLWEDTDIWLKNLKLEFCNEDEIHQEALQVLAQLTAIAVEQFHKCGELLLIKEHRSTADEADSLVQLTTTLTSLIGLVAGKFSEKLNVKSSQTGNKESANELITNVFFEAGNSSSYIQDAFQLLVPVLQVGAV